MKKIVIMLFVATFVLTHAAFAQEHRLLEIRNQIFDESKELKAQLSDTQDIILISSLWDSCLMTVSSLDAYFSMLGIVNTIKKDDTSPEAITYLESWLGDLKKSNDLNIKSLNSIGSSLEAKTRLRIIILKNYFVDLNEQIGSELAKLSMLKKTLRPKKKR